MDDAQSIKSFNDDLALGNIHGGVPMNILMTTSVTGRSKISQSTGKFFFKVKVNFMPCPSARTKRFLSGTKSDLSLTK